ncbi:hypothetical protein ACOSQ2_003073 [Xanthoceras sorbifolium]
MTHLYAICEALGEMRFGGFIFGKDLTKSTTLATVFHFFLRSLGQVTFIAQMIVSSPHDHAISLLWGVAIGPSFLSHYGNLEENILVPERDNLMLNSFERIALIFVFFLLHMFASPLSLPVSFFVKSYVTSEDIKQNKPFHLFAFIFTMSQFRQIIILLEDLKLLSSELGRTATVSALITWNPTIKRGTLFTHLSHFSLIVFIVCVLLRPIMLWMMRVVEGIIHIYNIIVMVFVCSLFGESTGQSAHYGLVILGVATHQTTHQWVLVCCEDLTRELPVVNFIFIIATLGKLLSAMIPSLYYNMPLKDAFSLGLIRSGRGLFDILYFYCVISKEAFSTIVMITIFQAVATAPVLRATYDTSRRYMAYNRRIIQHSKLQSVQIVVCIHELDNVSSIINILEVSNPTSENPFTTSSDHHKAERIQDEEAINNFKKSMYMKRQADHAADKEETLSEVTDTRRVPSEYGK